VNKTIKLTATYFLLLCILATLIPVNLLHQHIESLHCDITNVDIENDPCHASIYHKQDKKSFCKHNSHLTEIHDKCEFCKFLTPRRNQYSTFLFYQSSIIPILVSQDFLINQESFIQQHFSSSILGRAPPSC